MASVEIQKNVALELRDGEEFLQKLPVVTGKILMTNSRYLVITNQRIVFTLRSGNPFLKPEQAKSKEESINYSDVAGAKEHGLAGMSETVTLKMKNGKKRVIRVSTPKAKEKMSKEDYKTYYGEKSGMVALVNKFSGASKE